jgi:hypothetical protein
VSVRVEQKILLLQAQFFMGEFDYKAFQSKVLDQIKSGEPLLGKEGAFAPLLENLLNAALEGEMDAYMNETERSLGNRRNGYIPKQVQTQLGAVTVQCATNELSPE